MAQQKRKAATKKAAPQPVEVEVPKGHDMDRYQLFIEWLDEHGENRTGLTADHVLNVRQHYRHFIKSQTNQRYNNDKKSSREQQRTERRAAKSPTPTIKGKAATPKRATKASAGKAGLPHKRSARKAS